MTLPPDVPMTPRSWLKQLKTAGSSETVLADVENKIRLLPLLRRRTAEDATQLCQQVTDF